MVVYRIFDHKCVVQNCCSIDMGQMHSQPWHHESRMTYTREFVRIFGNDKVCTTSVLWKQCCAQRSGSWCFRRIKVSSSKPSQWPLLVADLTTSFFCFSTLLATLWSLDHRAHLRQAVHWVYLLLLFLSFDTEHYTTKTIKGSRKLSSWYVCHK